jgi:trans-2,3-dihydro-3-hydroxyanthranilate isomerase
VSSLPYEIVDVFTDRPFTGNPLAVVFGAEALAHDQMQTLARELNLSETVFVLPPSQPGATYRARIFTTEEELPFAGHPSVGAAVTVCRRGIGGPGQVVQECGAGLLPIQVYADAEHSRSRPLARRARPMGSVAHATLTGGTPTVGAPLDPAPLLASVGLSAGDFVGPAPRIAGCGLSFDYLAVSPDAVARAEVDSAAAKAAGVGMVSVFAWDAEARLAHTRVFCPGVGVPEDPATGSAALGLGVWLVACGLLPGDGEASYTVRQGAELHRPSVLECTVTAVDGAAASVTVTGSVVPVAKGEIAVPPFVG